MAWCNGLWPANFLREESGVTKVGVGDAKFYFLCFSKIFVFEVRFLQCVRQLSFVALSSQPGLNFDSWFHIVVRLSFRIFVSMGLVFSVGCGVLVWLWSHAWSHLIISFFFLGLGSSLQAHRTETMVDGLQCAASRQD